MSAIFKMEAISFLLLLFFGSYFSAGASTHIRTSTIPRIHRIPPSWTISETKLHNLAEKATSDTFLSISPLMKLNAILNTTEIVNRITLDSFIFSLENGYIPIQTVNFFDLAIGGKWRLKYSDAIISRPDPNLLFTVNQVIDSNGQMGNFSNVIQWSTIHPTKHTGELVVKCAYDLTTKGTMNIALQDHVLLSEIPMEEVENLLLSIQRSIPLEIFDPDQLNFATTYVDPLLRICRIRSVDMAVNIMNIFERILD